MEAVLLIVLAVAAEPPAKAAPPAGPSAEALAEEEREAAALGVVAGERIAEGHERARKDALEALATSGGPLPPRDELARLLGLDAVDVATLAQRREALRARLSSSALDSGPDAADAVGASDAGTALVAPADPALAWELAVIERALLRARLEAEKADELQGLVEAQRRAREKAEAEAASAEEARQRALEEARLTRSEMLQKLLTRLARAEGAKAELSAARAFLHRESERDLQEVRTAAERAEALLREAKDLERGSAAADKRFDDVLEAQRRALAGVGAALERRTIERPARDTLADLQREVAADRHAVAPSLSADVDGELQETLRRLDEALLTLDQLSQSLAADTGDRWFTVAEQRLDVARTLDKARLVLLARMSPERGRALRSVTADARDNLEVAALHAALRVRFHGVKRLHEAESLPARFSSLIEAGGLLWALGRALLLALVAAWLWRRAPAWLARFKHSVVGRSRTTTRARLWEQGLAVLAAVAPRAFVIAVALSLQDVLAPVAPEPELDIVVEVVLWIATYQLASKLGHMLVLRLARRRLSLTVHHKLKILRSVRLLMRYGFVVAYALSVTKDLLGGGVLHEGMQRFAALAALPLFVVLIQRWRADIVEAYLSGWPETRLAGAVRAAHGRWYGFFVATAAFAFVAGKAMVTLGRDFALGFDQTRRALAYLFRLRIERQARERARPDVNEAALPAEVREAFRDAPALKPDIVVDRFPGLAEAKRRALAAPGKGSSLLVHGPYGVGRTTWLHHLERALDGEREVVWARPEQRLLEPASLVQWLAVALGEGATGSARELSASLQRGERRVVFVDGLEWLYLRLVGGYAALDALYAIVRATRERLFWVMTAPTPAFHHLSRARLIETEVSATQRLSSWSEAEIRALIQTRQHASGQRVSFDDLLVQEVEGVPEAAHVVETEEGYIRLLWNFAEGNPRVAQHFWLRSLVPTPAGALKVNLYDAPSANDLEPLPEVDRFVLTAFVLHRCLDVEQAAATCDLAFGVVESHVLRGLERGIYAEVAPGSGRFVIGVHWWEAVLRFLRRKKLL